MGADVLNAALGGFATAGAGLAATGAVLANDVFEWKDPVEESACAEKNAGTAAGRFVSSPGGE